MSLACGFSHALAITAQGLVLSWGEGEGGRLGQGDELPRQTPTKISRLDYAQVSLLSAYDLLQPSTSCFTHFFTTGG